MRSLIVLLLALFSVSHVAWALASVSDDVAVANDDVAAGNDDVAAANDDDDGYELFAVLTGTNCAENLSYGPSDITKDGQTVNGVPNALNTAYLATTTSGQDVLHRSWLQIVTSDGTTELFRIYWTFSTARTLSDHFITAVNSGETVGYRVVRSDDTNFFYNGVWRFSDGADNMAAKFASPVTVNTPGFSFNSGAWGGGNGVINGNTTMPRDSPVQFWGVGNFQSTDNAQCIYVYQQGNPVYEPYTKTYMYYSTADVLPTDAPLASPTGAPIATPTKAPVAAPTGAPVVVPTKAPVASPTLKPTLHPTGAPIPEPTGAPIADPTGAPVASPTEKPSEKPSALPTKAPTANPTGAPIAHPTSVPIAEPTYAPTSKPSAEPSKAPVAHPTGAPVAQPTNKPVASPTGAPVAEPTFKPSVKPTFVPSAVVKTPSAKPSRLPSPAPSRTPTRAPSIKATVAPSRAPSRSPTRLPSAKPSRTPSRAPTGKVPSRAPTRVPSRRPTRLPSRAPTNRTPTRAPTRLPTAKAKSPTARPSRLPTRMPTKPHSAIQIRCIQIIIGITIWYYEHHNHGCDAVLKSAIVASVPGISEEDISDLQVSAASRRRMLLAGGGDNRNLRAGSMHPTDEEGITLEYTIRVPTEAGMTYEDLSAQLVESVETNRFTERIQQFAAEQDVPELQSASTSSIETADTTGPDADSSSSGSSSALSSGAIVGLAVGVCAALVLLAFIGRYLHSRRVASRELSHVDNSVSKSPFAFGGDSVASGNYIVGDDHARVTATATVATPVGHGALHDQEVAVAEPVK